MLLSQSIEKIDFHWKTFLYPTIEYERLPLNPTSEKRFHSSTILTPQSILV